LLTRLAQRIEQYLLALLLLCSTNVEPQSSQLLAMNLEAATFSGFGATHLLVLPHHLAQ
jgi:hypothetical protein